MRQKLRPDISPPFIAPLPPHSPTLHRLVLKPFRQPLPTPSSDNPTPKPTPIHISRHFLPHAPHPCHPSLAQPIWASSPPNPIPLPALTLSSPQAFRLPPQHTIFLLPPLHNPLLLPPLPNRSNTAPNTTILSPYSLPTTPVFSQPFKHSQYTILSPSPPPHHPCSSQPSNPPAPNIQCLSPPPDRPPFPPPPPPASPFLPPPFPAAFNSSPQHIMPFFLPQRPFPSPPHIPLSPPYHRPSELSPQHIILLTRTTPCSSPAFKHCPQCIHPFSSPSYNPPLPSLQSHSPTYKSFSASPSPQPPSPPHIPLLHTTSSPLPLPNLARHLPQHQPLLSPSPLPNPLRVFLAALPYKVAGTDGATQAAGEWRCPIAMLSASLSLVCVPIC
ncbi:hypothetical protein C7M84_006805 [Penaeus vannamei]|uniref:Uncharacterized protein n=1 Tax=Penaeus vannamei TaxID=6689 RepID=A0A423TE56_PENVA|nr:hypothetical protein C7M84_006805 [Penaeus vannamei]